MPQQTVVLMTADDLWKMPRNAQRHELVKGELRTMPPAGAEHGFIGGDIITILNNHVKPRKLGRVSNSDTGFILEHDPDTVRAPDVSFVRQERIDALGMTIKYWPEAPDLAVEVVSPSDTINEVDDKVEYWLATGTRLVWVVNPRKRTVTVYPNGGKEAILGPDDQLGGGAVLPEFRVAVKDLFV